MVLVNKSELGAGTRGSSLGFEALRIESINSKPINKIKYINDNNHLLFEGESKHKNAKNIDGITDLFYSNLDDVRSYLKTSENHFIFSADHSSTPLYVAALKANDPNEKIGLIWIDAHGDLHSPYTTPSGNMHGMPVCMILANDNLNVKNNELSDEENKNWQKLKDLGIKGPKIDLDDLVFLGLRDLEQEEVKIINNNNIFAKKVDEVREIGFDKISAQINNHLKECDRIFISFDVDSMDPNDVSFGTGTPVEDGFSFEGTKELLNYLTKSNKKISFEMVEINPLLDNKNKMARKSLEIFELVADNIKIDY